MVHGEAGTNRRAPVIEWGGTKARKELCPTSITTIAHLLLVRPYEVGGSSTLTVVATVEIPVLTNFSPLANM